MSGTRVSRRAMLGSVGAASLSPVLQASVSGVSASLDLPFARPAFAATLQTAEVHESAGGSRSASIIGGSIQGRRLSGAVQSGHIHWSASSGGSAVEVTTRLLVARPDGSLVEVHDRGVMPPDTDAARHAAIPTRTELAGVREEEGVPLLLVGRLDASGLGKRVLKLQAFEVS